MEQLNARYWENRYNQQTTGWDLGQCSPPLKAYIDQLENKQLEILIPGCGNAYEAYYLLKNGFTHITLIDIAENLVRKLKAQFEHTPIKVLNKDFFDLEGQFDLILEQTFFCAIDPKQRKTYVNKVADLLKPQGKLVGLLFDKVFEADGPPFGGTRVQYKELFGDQFELKTLETAYNSIKPRENSEVFINFIKK